MNNDHLSILIKKWKPHIIVKGSEFLLPLQKAITFSEDLAHAGGIIVGYDGWRCIDETKNWIVQALEVDISLEEYISWELMTPKKNLVILLPLLMRVPKNIDFISFQLDDIKVMEKIEKIIAF